MQPAPAASSFQSMVPEAPLRHSSPLRGMTIAAEIGAVQAPEQSEEPSAAQLAALRVLFPGASKEDFLKMFKSSSSGLK